MMQLQSNSMNFEDLFQQGLSLDKLRSFLAVARSGSVMAAAEGNSSRRSLMSRQISDLEKTLGVELFLRRGKSLSLSAPGRELALATATYFSEVENFVERATRETSTLRIGAGASVLEAMVFPNIREIRSQIPGLALELTTDSTKGILRSLHEGELDVGIVRSGEHGTGVVTYPCGRMEFSFVGRKDFDRRLPEWGLSHCLGRLPLAILRGSGQFASAFGNLCADLEVTPNIVVRTESFGQIRQALIAGIPGGVLPRCLTTTMNSGDFRIVKDERLSVLARDFVLVMDKRVAQVKTRLPGVAERLSALVRQ